MKKQKPGNLGTITGPAQICQGSSAQFSVQADTNSQQYRWIYPGGEDTTIVPFIIITFPLTATPGPGQIQVHGINPECGDGPASTKSITINQRPSVTNDPLVKTICYNTSTNITLTANIPGFTFAWIAWSTNPNLGGYFNNKRLLHQPEPYEHRHHHRYRPVQDCRYCKWLSG